MTPKTFPLQTIVVCCFCVIRASRSPLLLSSVVIHRHGDRNPFATYKTDPYRDESHWPEGFAQLTKRGIRRQYELGLWLHERYRQFLPPRYSPKSIRALSTDLDPTLMSAQATLAGLYLPTQERVIENLNWQPVPVHTQPTHDDPLLAMEKPCRKFQKMLDDLMKSQHMNEINEINNNLYEFLSNKTGEAVRDVYDVERIYHVLDTQFLADKALPNWAHEVYPDKMKPLVALRFKTPCYYEDLTRLRIGLLFGEIVRNFVGFVTGKSGVAKLLMFSGHDSTLAEVLFALGAYNNEVPPYSSAILLELYRDQEGAHVVNIFYRHNNILHEIVLDQCSFDCRFEDFTRILSPIVLPNLETWEKECEN